MGSTVIVMTSNIGAKYLLQDAEKNDYAIAEDEGFDEKKMQVDEDFDRIYTKRRKVKNETLNAVDKAMIAVKKYFRPEFLNRLNDICVFNPLKKRQLRQICSNEPHCKQAGQAWYIAG